MNVEKLLEYGSHGVSIGLIFLMITWIKIEAALRKKRLELDEKHMELDQRKIETDLRIAGELAGLSARIDAMRP